MIQILNDKLRVADLNIYKFVGFEDGSAITSHGPWGGVQYGIYIRAEGITNISTAAASVSSLELGKMTYIQALFTEMHATMLESFKLVMPVFSRK